MKKPLITLLTDFGTRDHYVASMKGVILQINPMCTLVDITHEVGPQDIREGAFLLANAYAYFPKGTIHLSVVDPGVGSPRKPMLLVTQNHFFVGPDNGLLSIAARRDGVRKAITLNNPKFFLSRVCATFHGRDIFAPVAAHLSLGVRPSLLGRKIDTWVELDVGKVKRTGDELVGEIVHVDSFGNLISNIDEDRLRRFAKRQALTIRIGKRVIKALKRGYWEGKRSEPMALLGSGGFLEVSVREGSAQKSLKVERGHPILIRRGH